MRTLFWLERCIESGILLENADCPFYIPTIVQALPSSILVAVTNFEGSLRACVEDVINLMGTTNESS
jgi:hypothetical protein